MSDPKYTRLVKGERAEVEKIDIPKEEFKRKVVNDNIEEVKTPPKKAVKK